MEDELPFAYFNPNNILVYWICGYNEEKKIISIFCGRNKSSDPEDKRSYICNSLDEAIEQRDTLVSNGWKVLKPPKVSFEFENDKKPKNTRERLKKKLRDKTADDIQLVKP